MCYFPQTASTAWTIPVVDSDAAITDLNASLFGAIRFGTGSVPPPSEALAVVASEDVTADAGNPTAHLEEFTKLSSTGGYLGADDFLAFNDNAEYGVKERGLLEDRGVFAMLLVVLIGGLDLNLTS